MDLLAFVITFLVLGVAVFLFFFKKRSAAQPTTSNLFGVNPPHSAGDADVLIVGAGPAGVTAACLLGMIGVRVLVVERDFNICDYPRAGAIHGDVMRAFQSFGASGHMLRDMHTQSVVFTSADGKPFFSIAPSQSADGFAKILFHYQPQLERVLRDSALSFPSVSFLLGHSVRSLQQHDDGSVTVLVQAMRQTGDVTAPAVTIPSSIQSASSPPELTSDPTQGCYGDQRTYHVRFVLGCDGGRSTIRQLLGVSMVGTSFAQRWFVCDSVCSDTKPVDTTAAAAAAAGTAATRTIGAGAGSLATISAVAATSAASTRSHEDTASRTCITDRTHTSNSSSDSLHTPSHLSSLVHSHVFGCDWRRPFVAVRLPKRHFRLELMLQDSEDGDQFLQDPMANPTIRAWLQAANAQPRRRALYKYHGLQAQRWRVGSVFLLGDAAHLMPPFAGQGLSSGVRDAFNLCWKLGLVLRGAANVNLLESYEAERRPDVSHLTRLAIFMGGRIQSRSPIMSRLVNGFFRIVGALRLGQRLTEGLKDNAPISNKGVVFGVSRLRSLLLRTSLCAPLWPLFSLTGQRLPQPQVQVLLEGGLNTVGQTVGKWSESTPLDEVLGCGFAVIVLHAKANIPTLATPLPPALSQFCTELGVQWVSVFACKPVVTAAGTDKAPVVLPKATAAAAAAAAAAAVPPVTIHSTSHHTHHHHPHNVFPTLADKSTLSKSPTAVVTVVDEGCTLRRAVGGGGGDRVIIVRPDRVVFWCGAAQELGQALRSLQAMLLQ